MASVNQLYVLTGSNIGPRHQYLIRATHLIERHIGPAIFKSAIYESEPWGFEADANFLNQAILCQTRLTPMEVLEQIRQIEAGMGRSRNSTGYESRTIDIDILYYNDETIQMPGLTIPHPHLHQRKFTLLPLAEIAPDLVHPILKKNNSELLRACRDDMKVWTFDFNAG
jgi:2-amino-4-hydroxy-6-hydroxymethyldihydropteridine diphosphokinase